MDGCLQSRDAAGFEKVLLLAGYVCSQAQPADLHCACIAYAEPDGLIPWQVSASAWVRRAKMAASVSVVTCRSRASVSRASREDCAKQVSALYVLTVILSQPDQLQYPLLYSVKYI